MAVEGPHCNPGLSRALVSPRSSMQSPAVVCMWLAGSAFVSESTPGLTQVHRHHEGPAVAAPTAVSVLLGCACCACCSLSY